MEITFIQDFTVVLLTAGLAGALCRALGASATFGYLLAGIIVSPHTLPVNLVGNLNSIRPLSQLGMIFLMFSTGMSLSFSRLRQVGGQLFFAVAVSALIIVDVLRTVGVVLHQEHQPFLFVAGMLVSSSSAIIGRLVHERDLLHRPVGRIALAFTLLEDLAAIILFSMLGAYAGAGKMPLMRQTGAFFSFLVLLGVASLLLVPRFLNFIQKRLPAELQTLLIAGLLCLVAVFATHAGYSPALGAFLLGLIIACTPQSAAIERTFSGLRDIFSAVFFVSIGMLIDVHVFLHIWPWLLIFSTGAVLVRLFGASVGLWLAGYDGRTVLSAAFTLTVTGEFSFIFAQFGISRGVLPEFTQALAVGACVMTAAFTSLVAPHNDRLVSFLLAHQPPLLARIGAGWRKFISSLGRRRRASRLWQFARRRFLQIGVEMLLIAGLLIFAEPLFNYVLDAVIPQAEQEWQVMLIFWVVFGSILLLPIIAIWRNVEALAMLYAQAAVLEESRQRSRVAFLENFLKLMATVGLAGWLAVFWPAHFLVWWMPLVVVLILGMLALVFWRKIIFWHSILEGRVYRALQSGEPQQRARQWSDKAAEWNMHIAECVLPDVSSLGGSSLADLNLRGRYRCAVIAVERQGHLIMNPHASTRIYPQDKLLLFGTEEQLSRARAWLMAAHQPMAAAGQLADIHFETAVVPASSPACGKTLLQLRIAEKFAVQVLAIRRAGLEYGNPSAVEILQAGDELLVLGMLRQLQHFRAWLEEPDISVVDPAAG